MVFLIPSWIAVTLFIGRVLKRILGVLFEILLFSLWSLGVLMVIVFHVATGLAKQEPGWARDLAKAIRALPETRRRSDESVR